METYSALRQFADSWFLIAMFGFFVCTWVCAFWPTLHAAREDAAAIPLRDEPAACSRNCAACACKTDFWEEANHG